MTRYVTLKEDTEEEKKYEMEGARNLRKYYLTPEPEQEGLRASGMAPHEVLAQRAADLILIALQTTEGVHDIEEERVDYILIGVAMEVLVKSIVLKEAPQYFISRMRDEKTPSLDKCINKLLELLSPRLAKYQLERLADVLKLVTQKRNNLVHLGFHRMDTYLESYQVANVLAYLFSRLSGQTTGSVVDKLTEFKKKEKDRIGSGLDYERVDFPIGAEQ